MQSPDTQRSAGLPPDQRPFSDSGADRRGHPFAWAKSEQPGKWASVVLTVMMHALLALLLFFGVQWRHNSSPEPVTVDLVRAPVSQTPTAPPTPKPEPMPPQEQTAPPPPPKPQPAPKPQVREPERPAPVKPDIAIKDRKPEPKPEKKEEPKPTPKPEPKPTPKPEPKPAPKPEPKPAAKPEPKVAQQPAKPPAVRAPTEDDRLRALMNQDSARAQAVSRQNELLRRSQEEVAGNSQAIQEWTERIVAKIRPKVVKPPNLTGRPRAVFNVTLLPDGSVNEVRLKSGSGNAALDASIERAIRASSPLPLPTRSEVFRSSLDLRFDPNDPAWGG